MRSPSFSSRRPHSASAGFSLIELIAVMAIIVIIATFTVPAATTMLRGSQLSQASSILTDQFALARQQALGKNRTVEVRLIRFADPEQPGEKAEDPSTGHFRAIQLMEVNEFNVAVPLKGTNLQRLPATIMMNESEEADLSTLITRADTTPNPPEKPLTIVRAKDVPTDPELPRGVKKNYEYVAFQFRADGSTNLPSSEKWFVTLHNANDASKVKSATDIKNVNFFTLQIDPVSGTTRTYRPTAG
jgi:uncharacterized protein (TIGR02596 family)